MKTSRWLTMLATMAFLLGCGKAYDAAAPMSAPTSESSQFDAPAKGYAGGGALGGEGPQVTLTARAQLKIIYTAQMELIVKDLSQAAAQLKKAIDNSGGFIASDELREHAGEIRTGHWRIRVPSEQFEALREAILEIGEPVQNKADSEDVTDQYFDLEGRIKNKKTEQEAIRRYLEDKKITAKLEEIVTVERELSRISGELEQLEGTMRRLQDRTALATIDVTFREIRDYVPPQAPTFGTRIDDAFRNSLRDLRTLGENLAVGGAALLPYLVVLLLLFLPALLVIRRIWRRMRRPHPPAPSTPFAATARE